MKSLIAIFTLLFLTVARAEDDQANAFRQAALRTLELIQAGGLHSVDNINISEIITATKSTSIVYNPHFSFQTQGRRCAYWQSANSQIRLNKACKDLSSVELGGIAIHEVLGISEGKDLNYEITSELLTNRTGKPIVSKERVGQIQTIKKANEAARKSGGSTLVGGGGDYDDLLLKIAGLEYLNGLKDDSTIYGIPVELLKITIKYMHTSAASNISTIFELRGKETDQRGPILYIQSDMYRSRDLRKLRVLAINAALLFLTYAPDEINLATPEFSGLSDATWTSTLISTPYLILNKEKNIFWENQDLTKSMNDVQKELYLRQAYSQAEESRDLFSYKLIRYLDGKVQTTEK